MSSSVSGAGASIPQGGGALRGIGEKFSPDLHTGTGNFYVPITLPAGRHGLQPALKLVYSTGHGNGPFGLGWTLDVPGVSRKTSDGIPRYDDALDEFILSGSEDLVPVETIGAATLYRPRTEGLFARILYHRDAANSYWEVRSKDGLVSRYGTAGSHGADPATVADPDRRANVFAWRLTRTEDTFGNRIEYEYLRDLGHEGPHRWDQLYLSRIRYVDHGADRANPEFLITVEFGYEARLDPYSECRAGFEVRTRKRCTRISVLTHEAADRLVRTYDLTYLDNRPELTAARPLNGVSLLSLVTVTGYDGEVTEQLPHLEFSYTRFDPRRRNFFPVTGTDLPMKSLADPDLALVDLFARGLPDLVEMNGAPRYWRNLGNGRFDMPRYMSEAPAGVTLGDPGVQFLDADGDGRTDLLVTSGAMSGYFPLSGDGGWDARSFRRYSQAPSFSLADPEVRLVDLDGDGITDAVRSGARFECFFNDPTVGWNQVRAVERQTAERFPNVDFSDPRVRWADFTGDGLQDIALLGDGNVEYWPNRGYGSWGERIHMSHSPRFPYGYDPRRILLGDVDGDGLADIVYVEDTRVTLWINQSGNGWSEPLTIVGTPPVDDADAVRLVDLLGSGIAGVLWTRRADGVSRERLFFLDFTGAVKPYLLHEMDNHIGAVTRVAYATSTRYYLEDQLRRERRWRTTAPFPVHVVSRVEVADHFSGGTITSEYRYHHGYWDGAEREYRGFGMVERFDTETFAAGAADHEFHSPPTMTRTWFHQGPVGDEFGDWREPDWSDQYWQDDPPLLRHTERVNQYLAGRPQTADSRRIKRDALRALRGSVLRTELYALDGSPREQRPYTVSESAYEVVEFDPPADPGDRRRRVFFPHLTAQRTTQWERGSDPMTGFSFTRYRRAEGDPFDPFGRPLAQTSVACPRGWKGMEDRPADGYLATHVVTAYAAPTTPAVYIHTRVASTTTFELRGTAGKTVTDLAAVTEASAGMSLVGHARSYYDGPAFVGLPIGQVGDHGASVRSETLALTDDVLQRAYGPDIPPYLEPAGAPAWTAEYPAEFRALLATRAGYAFHPGSASPADPAGYFVITERRRYDVHTDPDGRGLVLEVLDPLHDAARDPSAHRVLTAHDAFQLLPTEVTDAAGLTVRTAYDYRVLKPAEVTDPNGNVTRFGYSPLGLLTASWVRGKSPAEGDQQRPSVRVEYGFLAFENSPPSARQPIYVRTTRHLHHDSDLGVPTAERDDAITTVEYSDGFGRLLQTRTQDDDVRFGAPHFGGGEAVLPASQGDGPGGDVVGTANASLAAPNVVVSGWQRYDNKGQPVERYEPFFSEGWEYGSPADEQRGQKITLFYDPRGHTIRTRMPDGSEQLLVQGVPGTIAAPDLERPEVYEPTPWEAYSYDANDNAGRTHAASSAGYRHHWNTPSSILLDGLGRTVERVERNRDVPAGAAAPLAPIEVLRARIQYDIRGNVLAVVDPLGRTAIHNEFDMSNRSLRTESLDAGRRSSVPDAAGAAVEMRAANGSLVLSGYDRLCRPIRVWARDAAGEALTLRERLEYGDAGSAGQPPADRAAARATNRLRRLSRVFDEAGRLSSDTYDFKGNLLEKTRHVVADAAVLAGFAGPPPSWEVVAHRVDWTDPGGTPLDATSYTSALAYDALNRATRLTYPKGVDGARREGVPSYAPSGALRGVVLDGDTFVERIAYNAKGQRVLIARGNGVMTRYAYDPRTFRLLRLRTERFTASAGLRYRPAGPVLQDLVFEYDLAGSILAIRDRTPESGIGGTPLGRDALDRTFSYDAVYRLRTATGRECDVPSVTPWDDVPRCTDLTNVRPWTEEYEFDLAGNLTRLRHRSGTTAANSDFALAAGTNRLATVTRGADVFQYAYDANGNLARETTSRHFEWDHRDRMRAYRTQMAGSEPTVHTHYLYDSAGRRVKKVVRKPGNRVEATVYIDGIFEHELVVVAGAARENNTLHVNDDRDRIGCVRVGAPFAGDPTPAIKYHLADHLGSSTAVVDDAGALVNREEYTPYGATSFGSFARKRYRHSGKERDEESGLYYAGARYYAPWLARWVSADPAGPVDGLNLYHYVRGNPIRLSDPDGRESADTAADAGASSPPPPPRPPSADVKEDQIPGGVAPGPEGGKEVEYRADPERIKEQDDFVAGAKAGAVDTVVDAVGPKAVVQRAKGYVEKSIPIAGPKLADYLFNPLEKKAEALDQKLRLDAPQTPAGSAGYVTGIFAEGFLEALAMSAVSKGVRALAAARQEMPVINTGQKLEPFDADKLKRIQAALEKKGVTFQLNDTDLATKGYLGEYIPNTNPGGPGTIVLPPNPSRVAVIHELAHLGQHRKTGWARGWGSTPEGIRALEMANNFKLLGVKTVQWTRSEIELGIANWNRWRAAW